MELFTLRNQSFDVLRPQKETREEFINRCMREVVKVWPDGWMRLEDLHKEYEKRLVFFIFSKISLF